MARRLVVMSYGTSHLPRRRQLLDTPTTGNIKTS
jgi:hypothetical protein